MIHQVFGEGASGYGCKSGNSALGSKEQDGHCLKWSSFCQEHVLDFLRRHESQSVCLRTKWSNIGLYIERERQKLNVSRTSNIEMEPVGGQPWCRTDQCGAIVSSRIRNIVTSRKGNVRCLRLIGAVQMSIKLVAPTGSWIYAKRGTLGRS